ncbi:MAG: alpha/beta hydrolase [Mesorhizobium sp.]|nr:MAG: alpha/beta hydrolase [Mesorhizobium sp.]
MAEVLKRTMQIDQKADRAITGNDARAWLLSMMPVTERRLDLAGIPTAVLEGGDGPPLVLLHGPGEYAAKWFPIVPQLVRSNRIVVPDLPGHGASVVPGGAVGPDRVLDWLGGLLDATCPSPPVVVAQILGGAIAARFAAGHSEPLSRLVLVDTFGLVPFHPAPEFGRALNEFLADPNANTHDGLWRYCAFDLGRLRGRMGDGWDRIKAYNLDRARTASLHATQQSLMEQFAMPAIPRAELDRIAVPTTLIWGRHDLATPLSVAEAASKRFGWPLHVIEDAADDPPIEQPEAFLKSLDAALGRSPAPKGASQ